MNMNCTEERKGEVSYTSMSETFNPYCQLATVEDKTMVAPMSNDSIEVDLAMQQSNDPRSQSSLSQH